MQRRWIFTALLMAGLVSVSLSAFAQLTPAHRKELAEVTKMAGQAAASIRKKDYAAAETQLSQAEEAIKGIVTSSGVAETDPAIQRISTQIERHRQTLAKASGMGGGDDKGKGGGAAGDISFIKDIAPIIQARCVGCHGETNPRRRLRLDSFAGWQAGGQGGPLLIPGNPNASALIMRIHAAQGQGRMPANGDPLTDKEKETLTNWVRSGARFDGGNTATPFSQLIFEQEMKDVELPKPKGNETVSFSKDIAPWMTALCLNCHNSRRKQGGYSVETYFDIMKGGESGIVVFPGKTEDSRFFRLVGGLELPRMPQGQARLTRKNYEDMKKWFEEGNTFDGKDVRTPIRDLVPSEAEIAMEKFGSQTDAQMAELRLSQTESQFKQVLSTRFSPVTSNEFVIVGDVDQNRLEEVKTFATTQLTEIQKVYGSGGGLWRGKLAIFVWSDRSNFNQFFSSVERARAPGDVFGKAVIKLGHEEAYVVISDQGDSPAKGPSWKEVLTEQLTVAYLQKGNRQLPNWIVQGAGRVIAEPFASAERLKEWNDDARSLAPAVSRPDDIFEDATFSASASGAINYTVVKFLVKERGQPKFNDLLAAFGRGENPAAAFRATYNAEGAAIAAAYFASLKAR